MSGTARALRCSPASPGSARRSSGSWESKRRSGTSPVSSPAGVPEQRLRWPSLAFLIFSARSFMKECPCSTPPRRRALGLALLLAEPGDHPRMHTRSAWPSSILLRLSAERGPVLVALDDGQWLDPSSASVLQIAFRRLRDEPVGLLTTLRACRCRRVCTSRSAADSLVFLARHSTCCCWPSRPPPPVARGLPVPVGRQAVRLKGSASAPASSAEVGAWPMKHNNRGAEPHEQAVRGGTERRRSRTYPAWGCHA